MEFGWATSVSFRRKTRDSVEDELETHLKTLGITSGQFEIAESHKAKGPNTENLKALIADKDFRKRFWDVRVYGDMLLDKNEKGQNWRGPVAMRAALSVAKVNVITQTLSRKTGTEVGKPKGMGPEAVKIVEHGLYVMPASYRPGSGEKNGTTNDDLRLFFHLIPHAYDVGSVCRSGVNVVGAYVGVHKNRIGTFKRFDFVRNLTPVRLGSDPEAPSHSIDDYEFGTIDTTMDGDFYQIV